MLARTCTCRPKAAANDVLQRMKRGYTVEDYREMLGRIARRMPDAAVTSDFIVGFCGETDEISRRPTTSSRECRFKNSFIFKYSERPGTKGAELYPDDVPDEVKNRRNNELLALQNRISEQDNQPLLGQQVEVLVEGPSKRAETPTAKTRATLVQLTGRTPCDRIVVFDGNPRLIGRLFPSPSTTSPRTRCSARSSPNTSGRACSRFWRRDAVRRQFRCCR